MTRTVATAATRAAALTKAGTLVEALPWLARFHGAVVVLKYGGHAMADPELQRAFAEDVVFLHYAGLRPVIVHGGGPQITAHLERLGIPSEFRAGLRVTTPEAMQVVRMVLVGQVNGDVVRLVNDHGPFAVGMSGEDGGLMTAEPRTLVVEGEEIDLGLVGDVTAVDPGALRALLADGRIPVVATVAAGPDGQTYNVNADTAAAAIAVALEAQKLVVLTDVEGLYSSWSPDGTAGELVSEIGATDLATLLPSLSAGMAPKMEACLRAVQGGVPQAHVLDGRVPHAILLEVFTDSGIGTMVLPDETTPTPDSSAATAPAPDSSATRGPARGPAADGSAAGGPTAGPAADGSATGPAADGSAAGPAADGSAASGPAPAASPRAASPRAASAPAASAPPASAPAATAPTTGGPA